MGCVVLLTRRQMIQLESPNYKGLDLIQPLLRAVEQQFRIDFTYQSFANRKTARRLRTVIIKRMETNVVRRWPLQSDEAKALCLCA